MSGNEILAFRQMIGRVLGLSLLLYTLYELYEFEALHYIAMTDYNQFNASNTVIRCRV